MSSLRAAKETFGETMQGPTVQAGEFNLGGLGTRGLTGAWGRLIAAGAALCLVLPNSAVGQPRAGERFAVATFMQPQSDLQEPYPGGLGPTLAEFKEQTLRQTARIAVGGEALKITFSNVYGTTPVTLDRVRLAISLGLGVIDPATSKTVTFSGKSGVTLPPGKEVTTDPIPFRANALSELAVSIYMKHAPVRTAHRIAPTTSYVAPGDQTGAASLTGAATSASNYYMPKIVALRPTKANLLVAIGDSITASGVLNKDAHRSWPDQLAAMIHARTENFSVVNAGIGGNRWVRNNMGPCGLCRLDHDVLKTEGATHVVFALGVNDLGLGLRYANGFKDPAETVTAAQIIDAMQAAIARSKAKGLKVYVATIVPFRPRASDEYKSDYYTSGRADEVPYGSKEPLNGERMRQEINAFIRNNRTIDGVIDIDRAVADPAAPLMERKELTADGLHLNERGSSLFAQLVYEAIFGERKN